MRIGGRERIVLAILAAFLTSMAQPVFAGVDEDKATVVKGNNSFALDLYARLKDKEGNIFFSPHSISTALAMTYAGARANTESQMSKVLHFTLPKAKLHPAYGNTVKELNAKGKKSAFQLSVANALWGQKGFSFRKEYLDLVSENYEGGLNEMDFRGATEKSRQTINAWVEKETKDKIKELIKPGMLNAATRLVLTNAIYFKGDWDSQFEKKMTKDAPFTMTGGGKTNVPMMFKKADFRYKETQDLQVLELPYVKKQLSMIVLLPKKTDGLPELEKSLTQENLDKWTRKIFPREVKVYLPRFKMTSEFELGDTLKLMGMTDAFNAGAADFSGMTGSKDLYISAVVHKAYVDVNEEGTEAAAATAVVMRLTSVARPLEFRADHPFLFLIRDNATGSILFMGRVVDPKGE